MIRETVTIRGKRFVMVEETKLRRIGSPGPQGRDAIAAPASRRRQRKSPGLDYIRARSPETLSGSGGPSASAKSDWPNWPGSAKRRSPGWSPEAFAHRADRREDRRRAETLLPRAEQPTPREEKRVGQGIQRRRSNTAESSLAG